jgi:sialate O-acetylesterase
MRKLILPFLLLLLLLRSQTFGAEFAAADIFSSGLVLQRDRPIPVWGTAPDGTEVTVSFADVSATGASVGGKWRVELPAQKASANPRSLKILFKGGEEITVDDVLVGEVWLCAGQSNMAQRIGQNPPRELADMPLVRQFAKGRGKESANPPRWTAAVGEDLALLSVTAAYFGEQLFKELNVPVGLILTAVSGTPIESWIPLQTLRADAATKVLLDKASDKETRQKMNEARKKSRENPEEAMAPELAELVTLGNAGSLYAAHIEPIMPFPVRGVIWYQGEANSRTPENAFRYGHYLTLLVASLREACLQPDLPFLLVQLPSIDEGPKEQGKARVYEIVREQQRRFVQETPHAGLAVSVDVNEGLHPRHKNIMGDRLAAIALAEVFGKKAAGSHAGPMLKSVTFKGKQAICSFSHAEEGLELRNPDAGLFEIAGADGVFHPATASLEGGNLVVVSDAVAEAREVRYASKPSMKMVSLYGASGLPASPFRFPSP